MPATGYTRLVTAPATTPDPAADVQITVCTDGPLLVRGPIRVVAEDGTELPGRRSTVALCRCGLTGRPPWCDGSHKVAAGPRRHQPR